MNLYVLIALVSLGTNAADSITSLKGETVVNSDFIQGNWKVSEINNNGNKSFSRDTYRFFNDKTGYQGRNQRIDWTMENGDLVLVTYENGQMNVTNWKARKDYKENLILTRFQTEEFEGKLITKIIRIKLLKQ